MQMPTATFKITPPYDFRKSLSFSRRSRFETVIEKEGLWLRRVLALGQTTLLVEISCRGKIENPTGLVRWQVLDGPPIKTTILLPPVRRILSADLDLHPFLDKATASKYLRPLVERNRGLKPILTPTIFESAAWAIMGQQVNLNFACKIKQALTEKYGPRHLHGGEIFHRFPGPENLAEAAVDDLRPLQFSTRKAEYILGLRDILLREDSHLDCLGALDYESAVRELRKIRGIGIWSADYILLRGAGHRDCLPLGDSGLNRALKNIYRMKKLPDIQKAEKLAQPFRPFRSLFTLYCWYSLIEESEDV